MLPVLFDARIATVHVHLQSYTTLLAFGLIAGVALALAIAHARGLPLGRSAVVFTAAVVAAAFGARLLHVATFLPLFRDDPASALATGVSGLALYGGLTFAVIAAAMATRVLRVDLWRLSDAAAPGIALGIAIAKLGCFSAGCCHGYVTHGPLGVDFGLGSSAHAAQLLAGTVGLLGPVLPVLPVQLFEAAAALFVAVAAFVLGRRAPSGVAFLATAMGFSAARVVLQPLRWTEAGFGAPTWLYPALYAAVIVLSGVLAWRRVLSYARSSPPEST